VVFFDTAGRTILDDTLMQELEEIKRSTRPENILLVVDAMIGQESVNVAREFDRRLDLSGSSSQSSMVMPGVGQRCP